MKKLLSFLIIVVLISGIIGFAIGKSQKKEPDLRFAAKAIRTSQNGLINPLVEYEIASSLYKEELKNIRGGVQKEVNSQIGSGNVSKMAVYFRSLNDGPWFGINQDDNFFPASLLKVPIMIAYFKLSETNPDILKKEVKYDESYSQKFGDANNDSYFKPENSIELGKTYTIEDLIRFMIVYSDNNAKNLLISNLSDINVLLRVYTDLGISSAPELQSEEDILSVHEYSTILRVLYNASYLTKDFSKKALALLSQTQFQKGLKDSLPKNLKIANKFGEYSNRTTRQLHDCGIVYYPDNPYILCLMTRGTNFEKMEDAISSISKSVYREVQHQLQNK